MRFVHEVVANLVPSRVEWVERQRVQPLEDDIFQNVLSERSAASVCSKIRPRIKLRCELPWLCLRVGRRVGCWRGARGAIGRIQEAKFEE